MQLQLQTIIRFISTFIEEQHTQGFSQSKDLTKYKQKLQLQDIANRVAALKTVDELDEIEAMFRNLAL